MVFLREFSSFKLIWFVAAALAFFGVSQAWLQITVEMPPSTTSSWFSTLINKWERAFMWTDMWASQPYTVQPWRMYEKQWSADINSSYTGWVLNNTWLWINTWSVPFGFGIDDMRFWFSPFLWYWQYGVWFCVNGANPYWSCSAKWQVMRWPWAYLGYWTNDTFWLNFHVNWRNSVRVFYNFDLMNGRATLFTWNLNNPWSYFLDAALLSNNPWYPKDWFDSLMWATTSDIDWYTTWSSDAVKTYEFSQPVQSIFNGWGNGISFVMWSYSYTTWQIWTWLQFYSIVPMNVDYMNNPWTSVRGWSWFLTIPLAPALYNGFDWHLEKTLLIAKDWVRLKYTIYNCWSSDPYVLMNCGVYSVGYLGGYPDANWPWTTQFTWLFNSVWTNVDNSRSYFHRMFLDSAFLAKNWDGWLMYSLSKTVTWYSHTGIAFNEFWYDWGWSNHNWYALALEENLSLITVLGGNSDWTSPFQPWNPTWFTPTAWLLGALTVPYCQGGNCILTFPSGVNMPSGALNGIFTWDINIYSWFLANWEAYCADDLWASLHQDFCNAMFSTTTGNNSTPWFVLSQCPQDFSDAWAALHFNISDFWWSDSWRWNVVGWFSNNVTDVDVNLLAPFQCLYGGMKLWFNDVSYRSFITWNRLIWSWMVPDYMTWKVEASTGAMNLIIVMWNITLAALAVYIIYKVIKIA